MRYLTELNDWLGRDSQDRQSEFRGIETRIDVLNTRIDGFIHQSQPCQTLRGFHDYLSFISSTFPRCTQCARINRRSSITGRNTGGHYHPPNRDLGGT